MKHIYLFGASDDCHEVETSWGEDFEGYGDILIGLGGLHTLRCRYVYDGDWGIEVIGDIPKSVIAKFITGNDPIRKENSGQFVHLQVPESVTVTFSEEQTK